MIDIGSSMVLSEQDLIKEYAIASGKTIVHIRADGPKKYPDKATEVWNFLDGICDDNVRHLLMQIGEVYCRFESDDQAYDCIERWFPDKRLLDDAEYDLGEEYYIYAYGVSGSGVPIVHN